MSRLHLKYVMFQMSRERVYDYKFTDSRLGDVITLMTKIFALQTLKNDNANLYECGFFVKGSMKLLDEAYNTCLKELRPHFINILELRSLDREESYILSTIGNRYGDIYEKQLEVAKASRLNTGSPPPYFEKLMKPII